MNRQTVFRWFTIGIIAAFVLELFVVVMYSGTTNQVTPTPTPTPAASVSSSFTGLGAAAARVTAFGTQALIKCAGADARAEGIVARHPEFQNVLRFKDLLQADVNASLSAEKFANASAQLEAELAPVCPGALVGRQAFIEFTSSQVNLISPSGGSNATLYARDLANYYTLAYRTLPFAYVRPATGVNDSIRVRVQASLTNGLPNAQNGDRVFTEEQPTPTSLPFEVLPAANASVNASNSFSLNSTTSSNASAVSSHSSNSS